MGKLARGTTDCSPPSAFRLSPLASVTTCCLYLIFVLLHYYVQVMHESNITNHNFGNNSKKLEGMQNKKTRLTFEMTQFTQKMSRLFVHQICPKICPYLLGILYSVKSQKDCVGKVVIGQLQTCHSVYFWIQIYTGIISTKNTTNM